jgi:hypothetical protein
VSRYDLFRRRIAPVAFGLAIVLIARDACNKQERTHATIVLDYGAAKGNVRAVDVELWAEGELLSQFHRQALEGSTIGTTKFAALSTSKDAELHIDVDLGTSHKLITRRFHAEEGATVTIPLEDQLR